MRNKKIIIFGDTMFSAELMKIVSSECGKDKVIAFTVDSKYKSAEDFCGFPIYPFEELEQYVDMGNTEILLTIGYNKMNKLRSQKYQECKTKGFNVHTFISKHAIVYTDDIGEGSIIMPRAYIGPFSTLGIGNVIRAGCVLSHHETIGNFNWIADGSIYGGHVQQGSNSFIGLGTTVRNGISIADRTFVGAHSYLSSDTTEGSVYIGSPAKIFEKTNSNEIILKV